MLNANIPSRGGGTHVLIRRRGGVTRLYGLVGEGEANIHQVPEREKRFGLEVDSF